MKISTLSPIVNMLSDPTITVKRGESITLKCKLRGYPQPKVTWTDTTGAVWSSKVSQSVLNNVSSYCTKILSYHLDTHTHKILHNTI